MTLRITHTAQYLMCEEFTASLADTMYGAPILDLEKESVSFDIFEMLDGATLVGGQIHVVEPITVVPKLDGGEPPKPETENIGITFVASLGTGSDGEKFFAKADLAGGGAGQLIGLNYRFSRGERVCLTLAPTAEANVDTITGKFTVILYFTIDGRAHKLIPN